MNRRGPGTNQIARAGEREAVFAAEQAATLIDSEDPDLLAKDAEWASTLDDGLACAGGTPPWRDLACVPRGRPSGGAGQEPSGRGRFGRRTQLGFRTRSFRGGATLQVGNPVTVAAGGSRPGSAGRSGGCRVPGGPLGVPAAAAAPAGRARAGHTGRDRVRPRPDPRDRLKKGGANFRSPELHQMRPARKAAVDEKSDPEDYVQIRCCYVR